MGNVTVPVRNVTSKQLSRERRGTVVATESNRFRVFWYASQGWEGLGVQSLRFSVEY